LIPEVPTFNPNDGPALLFLHGTFSDTASAFRGLANTPFFSNASKLYGDRIFAFNHFTLSKTPEQNAEELLKDLSNNPFTFDVVTHSRGGLVLRNLVERTSVLGEMAKRFQLRRAVLVACPNSGTPLANPLRWKDTVGWFANLVELFPENPFSFAASWIAESIVWLAHRAVGALAALGKVRNCE